jgi:hypothetical protein
LRSSEYDAEEHRLICSVAAVPPAQYGLIQADEPEIASPISFAPITANSTDTITAV